MGILDQLVKASVANWLSNDEDATGNPRDGNAEDAPADAVARGAASDGDDPGLDVAQALLDARDRQRVRTSKCSSDVAAQRQITPHGA